MNVRAPEQDYESICAGFHWRDVLDRLDWSADGSAFDILEATAW
jgi:hypothetical protein